MGTGLVLGAYISGVVLGSAITAFRAGSCDNTDIPHGETKDDIISMRIGLSFLWPLAVAAIAISAPFFGVYKLGQWYGKRI